MVKDFCDCYSACNLNGATQLNIIIILRLLKREDRISFLEKIANDKTQDWMIVDAAKDAMKVIQG